MQGSDLVSLLTPDPGSGVGFRQGVIASWNPATGENTVQVGGAILENVPILNTGEAIALKPGHVVGMLTTRSSWFIIGRITPAGDPNFAAASVAFGSAGAQVFNYSVSTANVIKASSNELVVPVWADEALVLVTGFGSLTNNNAGFQFVSLEVGCFGGSGGAANWGFQGGATGGLAATSRNRFTGLSGGEVLQITGSMQGSAAIAAAAANSLFLHAIALYKSNV